MKCKCCEDFFEKGTGHLMMCGCGKVVPMCQECYEDGIRTGEIEDTHYKMSEASPQLDERLI